MQKVLELAIRVSKDGTSCMDEKFKLCDHYVAGKCDVFDATLHMDPKERPLCCSLCLRLQEAIASTPKTR
jgi:hypothetical protein